MYPGTTDLASNVVSPLLTAEAIELLRNCLTSQETALWVSLGQAWNTSRFTTHYTLNHTPNYIANYTTN